MWWKQRLPDQCKNGRSDREILVKGLKVCFSYFEFVNVTYVGDFFKLPT